MNPYAFTIGAILYVFIAGLVWQLFERSESDLLEVLCVAAGVFWPLILPVAVAIAVGYVIAYRAPRWAIERATRPRMKLPPARTVKR